MKRILRGIIVITIIVSILMYSTRSLAENLNNLQDEKKDVNQQINDKKEELEEITNVKTATLAQVEKLITQISKYQGEIDDLDGQISDLKTKISNAEKQIKKDEEDYKKQEAELNARLATMYKNGTTSYLDFLLSSSSIVDFISSYYLISQMAEYDEKMLAEVAAHKEKIEKEKAELVENKKEVENSQKALQTKKQALQVVRKEKEQYAAKLTDEEKSAQAKIQELQDANDDLDKRIRKAKAEIAEAKARAEREAAARAASARTTSQSSENNSASYGTTSASTGNASSYGLIWPTLTRYHITTGWYYSSGKLHGASDISGYGIYGTPVYAAADGYVVVSTALINSSGNYYSYGNYILIAHYNGLYTLYAHMSKRIATAGQSVTQGQVIGYIGSTGNSTGPHLHFEVRTGNGTWSDRVNPIYYLPSK